jgi:hypothetical protein
MEKPRVYPVGDEVRWNDPTRNYILDIVQIKLVESELSKIEKIHLIDETIYFLGHRGKESTLYFIHVYYFFSTK